jgi:hypothetical protein
MAILLVDIFGYFDFFYLLMAIGGYFIDDYSIAGYYFHDY